VTVTIGSHAAEVTRGELSLLQGEACSTQAATDKSLSIDTYDLSEIFSMLNFPYYSNIFIFWRIFGRQIRRLGV